MVKRNPKFDCRRAMTTIAGRPRRYVRVHLRNGGTMFVSTSPDPEDPDRPFYISQMHYATMGFMERYATEKEAIAAAKEELLAEDVKQHLTREVVEL